MDEEMNRWVEGYSRWKKQPTGRCQEAGFYLSTQMFYLLLQAPFLRPVWQEVKKMSLEICLVPKSPYIPVTFLLFLLSLYCLRPVFKSPPGQLTFNSRNL